LARSIQSLTFYSCILHKVRSSLKKVRVRHRAAVGEDLKRIYRQKDEASFKGAFNEFKERWGRMYPKGHEILGGRS